MPSLVRVLLVLLVAAFAATGCPGPDYPKCENDDQCKTKKVKGKEVKIDEYCVFGQCQECAKDSNCDEGEKCKKGRCESQCTSDAACGEGRICDGSQCHAAECTPQKGCGDGRSCNAGRCTGAATNNNNNGGNNGTTGVSSTNKPCNKSERVQFDFNVYDLRPESRETLDHFAQCMRDNAAWKLTVEGHADDRGTTEYNLQLGEKRASSIRDYLVKLGVDKARVKTISYGEERPIQQGEGEDVWAANRRGELIAQ